MVTTTLVYMTLVFIRFLICHLPFHPTSPSTAPYPHSSPYPVAPTTRMPHPHHYQHHGSGTAERNTDITSIDFRAVRAPASAPSSKYKSASLQLQDLPLSAERDQRGRTWRGFGSGYRRPEGREYTCHALLQARCGLGRVCQGLPAELMLNCRMKLTEG